MSGDKISAAGRGGYEVAIATLRDVANRTGSPAARWAADYLAVDPDKLSPPASPAQAAARVALTMTADAGEVFLKALVYAANRIPSNARMEGAEMSHEDWLRWGASRLDAAIRAAVPAVPAATDDQEVAEEI